MFESDSLEGERNRRKFIDNVDICATIVGGTKPPTLPLREEVLSQGFECVYDAKGAGETVVNRERKRREEALLARVKAVEKKLRKKNAARKSKRRLKSLKLLQKLRREMQNSSKGISYELYLEELLRLRGMKKEDVENHRAHIENQILDVLEYIEIDNSTVDDSNTISTGCSVSTYDYTEASGNTTPNTVSSYADADRRNLEPVNEERNPIETMALLQSESLSTRDLDGSMRDSVRSSKETIVMSNVTSSDSNRMNSLSSSNLLGAEYLLDSINEETKDSPTASVTFIDVKPSTEDTLSRAKAILENARTVHHTYSSDSSVPKEDVSKAPKSQVSPKPLLVRETGRYHLIVAHACPLSHRVMIVRGLKGLESVISYSYVDCDWDPKLFKNSTSKTRSNSDRDIPFWVISNQKNSQKKEDAILNSFMEYYQSGEEKKYLTVPILWDKKEKAVLSNSSVEIMKIINSKFNQWAKRPKLNLFPRKNAKQKSVNDWLSASINHGVYRCGVAPTQELYDNAIDDVTTALQKAEKVVKKKGFLTGDRLTESDVRLFVTLIRFDEVYRILFNVNTKQISRMSGLFSYTRDIYQIGGVKETCDLNKIKSQYYSVNDAGNGFIIPRGSSFMQLLEE